MAREYPVSARTPMQNFPAYSITYNRTGSFPRLSDPRGLERWRSEGWSETRCGSRSRRSRRCRACRTPSSITVWRAGPRWAPGPVFRCRPSPRWSSRTAEARYLRFDSFDSRYYNGWDLASAMHPQTILAYAYNDRPLMMNRGAPLRLYSPVKLGYKLTKYLSGHDLYPGSAGRLLGGPGVSLVRRSLAEIFHLDRDLGGPIGQIVHGYPPGPAADLAIFHILLLAPTAGIQRDLVDFSAVRAAYAGAGLDGAVAEGELLIQTIVV